MTDASQFTVRTLSNITRRVSELLALVADAPKGVPPAVAEAASAAAGAMDQAVTEATAAVNAARPVAPR